MDKVVHFEIPAANLNRAKKFYQQTFDWKLTDYPEMQYVIAHTGAVDKKNMLKEKGVINGGMMKKSATVKAPSLSIQVDNIDTAMAKVKKAGGKLIKGKMKVGEMGWMCYFKDTEGNVLSLWQNI